MFIVIDPIGIVPLYIGITSHIESQKKKWIVRSAVFISFLVLLFFVFLGRFILALLGIQPGSFYIAGGIMLFLVSMEMLFGKPNQSKVSSRERPESPDSGDDSQSIAVFPLAIPMLAGPGAITAIILFTGGAGNTPETPGHLMMTATLLVSLITIMAIVWAVLSGSDIILRVLGKTGVSVFERIMGLLLSGMSVQFVYDGIVRLGLVPGAP